MPISLKAAAVGFALLVSLATFASPQAPSPKEFQDLLKLDYKAFDQTVPAGGWRSIVDHVEAGKVLDAYHVQNLENLTADQARIIYWHAGQLYAIADLRDVALSRFKKTYDAEEKQTDTFKWNSYVKGTIAFLEGDMPKLIEARDELRAVDKIVPNGNLKFLEAFVRCSKKPYSEAYNPSCN